MAPFFCELVDLTHFNRYIFKVRLGLGEIETERQRDRDTEGQRDRGKERQRDREMAIKIPSKAG